MAIGPPRIFFQMASIPLNPRQPSGGLKRAGVRLTQLTQPFFLVEERQIRTDTTDTTSRLTSFENFARLGVNVKRWRKRTPALRLLLRYLPEPSSLQKLINCGLRELLGVEKHPALTVNITHAKSVLERAILDLLQESPCRLNSFIRGQSINPASVRFKIGAPLFGLLDAAKGNLLLRLSQNKAMRVTVRSAASIRWKISARLGMS